MANLRFSWGFFRDLIDYSRTTVSTYGAPQVKADYLRLAASTPTTVSAAVTAFAGGGQGSATAITADFSNITTCATAGDSVKLPAATTGATYTITNRGAASANVFPATGDTINGGSANAAIALPVGATYEFVAINTTDWKSNTVTASTGDGTVALPSHTFAADSDTGIYRIGANNIGVAANGAKVLDIGTTGLGVTGALTSTTTVTEGSTTAITAFAGGGQGSATQLTTTFNEITTCATAGDSVKLPSAAAGLRVTIKNNGAAAADVFPTTGDSIDAGAANAAIRLAVGETMTFVAVDATVWESSLPGAGTVGNPSLPVGRPANGFYEVSSTQVGASIGGALKGGFDSNGIFTGTISEQVAAAGVTIDGALVKDGGISANSMFAGFYPTAAGQALSGAGAVNVTAYYTAWTTTGADAGTMAAGTQIGQRKKIKMVVDGGDGTLTPTSLSGGTTITFNDAGDYVEMIWNGANWFVIENFGCTVA